MKAIITIMAFLTIISCNSYNKGGLSGKTETLELTHITWACDCANWATKEDLKKYSEDLDSLSWHSIFVEPANKAFELPDTIGFNSDIVKFTGQFYNGRGFPEDYQSFQYPKKSRVFRYTKYEVLKSNYRENLESSNEIE